MLEVELYCSWIDIYVFRITDDNYLSVSRTIVEDNGKIELSDETIDKIYKLATETMKVDPRSALYGTSAVEDIFVNYEGETKSYNVIANDVYGENTAPYDRCCKTA